MNNIVDVLHRIFYISTNNPRVVLVKTIGDTSEHAFYKIHYSHLYHIDE